MPDTTTNVATTTYYADGYGIVLLTCCCDLAVIPCVDVIDPALGMLFSSRNATLGRAESSGGLPVKSAAGRPAETTMTTPNSGNPRCPHYCPICMAYCSRTAVTGCCQQNICLDCLDAMLKKVASKAPLAAACSKLTSSGGPVLQKHWAYLREIHQPLADHLRRLCAVRGLPAVELKSVADGEKVIYEPIVVVSCPFCCRGMSLTLALSAQAASRVYKSTPSPAPKEAPAACDDTSAVTIFQRLNFSTASSSGSSISPPNSGRERSATAPNSGRTIQVTPVVAGLDDGYVHPFGLPEDASPFSPIASRPPDSSRYHAAMLSPSPYLPLGMSSDTRGRSHHNASVASGASPYGRVAGSPVRGSQGAWAHRTTPAKPTVGAYAAHAVSPGHHGIDSSRVRRSDLMDVVAPPAALDAQATPERPVNPLSAPKPAQPRTVQTSQPSAQSQLLPSLKGARRISKSEPARVGDAPTFNRPAGVTAKAPQDIIRDSARGNGASGRNSRRAAKPEKEKEKEKESSWCSIQ